MEELSKLEYIAAMVLQGMLANPDNNEKKPDVMVSNAVFLAKELIKGVEKHEPSRRANELLKRATGQQ